MNTDSHGSVLYAATDNDVEVMKERMSAYIFPNTPCTADEKTAFENAVMYQLEHESTMSGNGNSDTTMNLPNGIKSFSLGKFSVSLSDDYTSNTSVITDKNICASAYSVLLRAGLLYKGVL